MTRDPDFIGLVERYLDDFVGDTPLPDATRAEIGARLHSTRQRRSWWPARRLNPMHTNAKFALAAAAAAAVVLVALALGERPAPSGIGTDGHDPASVPPTAEPTASAAPMLRPSGALPAGTYRANAFIPLDVEITVPDGWTAGGDWLLLGPRGVEGPDGMNIRFGSVENLYADPFDADEGLLAPKVGPTVDDLVAAMTDHPDWPVAPPTDVTLDGYAGKVVRMTLPADLELPNGFMLFRDELFGDHLAFEPGQIVDFYIVDVEGERLVLELFSYAGTPADDLAERQTILDSIQLRSRS